MKEFWFYKLSIRHLKNNDYHSAEKTLYQALTYAKEGSKEKIEELIRWMQSLQR